MNAAVPIPPDRFSIVIVTTNREILLPFSAKTIKTKLDFFREKLGYFYANDILIEENRIWKDHL